MLVTLVNYLYKFYNKIDQAGDAGHVSYISIAPKVFDLKEEDLLEALPEETARGKKRLAQKVSFLSSSFRAALENISLWSGSWTNVGIIGGTGSGKSTLVQLLSHLYAVSQGLALHRIKVTL